MWTRPKVPKKKYMETEGGDGEQAGANSKDSVSPSSSEEIVYKLYNWDVERINRLAQPRVRHRELADQLASSSSSEKQQQQQQHAKQLREISPRKKTSQTGQIKSRSPTKTANRVSLSGEEYYLMQKQTRRTLEAKLAESTEFSRGQIYPKSREYKHKGLEQLVYNSATDINTQHVLLDKPLKMRSEKVMTKTKEKTNKLKDPDFDAIYLRYQQNTG